MKFFLILLLVVSTMNAMVSAIEDVDVVIIGAGATGISAGLEALKRGLTFIMLEATSVIGGRVNTTYGPDPVRFPNPVEMGALWAHSEFMNDLYPVLVSLGIPTRVFDQTDSSVWDDGKLQSYGQVRTLVNGATGVLTQTEPCNAVGVSDATAQRQCGYDGTNNKYETYFEFGQEQWIGNNIEYHDSKAWSTSTEDGGPDRVIIGGYINAFNTIIDSSPSIRSNIRLNSVVLNIDYSSPSGRAIITYKNNGVTRTIRANKRVVVTVSINVLKADDISFIPPIPTSHRNAMNELMCSEANKVAMFFDAAGAAVLSNSDLAHNYMHRYGKGVNPRINDGLSAFINWQHFYGQAVVTSYYVGDYSRMMENLSNEEIQQRHYAAVTEIAPSLPPPIHYEITRWGKTPYAKCSYTDVKVGGTFDAFNRLGVPFGPNGIMIFAGEASNPPQHGTVHAGWLSGKQSIQSIPLSS